MKKQELLSCRKVTIQKILEEKLPVSERDKQDREKRKERLGKKIKLSRETERKESADKEDQDKSKEVERTGGK